MFIGKSARTTNLANCNLHHPENRGPGFRAKPENTGLCGSFAKAQARPGFPGFAGNEAQARPGFSGFAGNEAHARPGRSGLTLREVGPGARPSLSEVLWADNRLRKQR